MDANGFLFYALIRLNDKNNFYILVYESGYNPHITTLEGETIKSLKCGKFNES